MSRFGGGPSGLQGAPLALSSKIKTLWSERERERGLMRWQDMHLNLNTDQINKYITIYVRRTCIHLIYISCIHLCLLPVDNRFVWRAAKDSLQRCSVVARLCSVPFSVV